MSSFRQSKDMLRGGPLELFVLCLFALVTSLLQLPQNLMPILADDSFQYLSAANQLSESGRMATSLVHFDTERSHGTLPAPLTWFPPGYPLAVAAVSTLGFSHESSALLVSILCFVLVTAETCLLARALDPSPWVVRIVAFCWLINSYALSFSVSAVSEIMFTVLGLGAILLLVYSGSNKSKRNTAYWVGSALFAGASYWVRYAGLLWVVVCFVLLLAQLVTSGNGKRGLWRPFVFSGFALLLSVMPLMLRNMLLVGDWRGGNNTPAAGRPISQLIEETPRLLHHLILGDVIISQLWIPIAVSAIGLIGLCIITYRAGSLGRAFRIPELRSSLISPIPRWGIVLAAILIYASGIAAIALRSPISYNSRMLLPALPLIIVSVVCGTATLLRTIPAGTYSRVAAVTLALLPLLGYTLGNAVSRVSRGYDSYQKTLAALSLPDETGQSLKAYLDRELKPGDVVVASNGQATGYILKHPTLSLVGRPYTPLDWNESELKAQVARYRATHVVIFRNADLDPGSHEYPFLKGLADGRAPSWLRLARFNREIYVYRADGEVQLPR